MKILACFKTLQGQPELVFIPVSDNIRPSSSSLDFIAVDNIPDKETGNNFIELLERSNEEYNNGSIPMIRYYTKQS